MELPNAPGTSTVGLQVRRPRDARTRNPRFVSDRETDTRHAYIRMANGDDADEAGTDAGHAKLCLLHGRHWLQTISNGQYKIDCIDQVFFTAKTPGHAACAGAPDRNREPNPCTIRETFPRIVPARGAGCTSGGSPRISLLFAASHTSPIRTAAGGFGRGERGGSSITILAGTFAVPMQIVNTVYQSSRTARAAVPRPPEQSRRECHA